MDFQCALYPQEATVTSYLECLRQASSSTVLDYYSNREMPISSLDARAMIRVMHERTMMSPVLASPFNDICTKVYEQVSEVKRHFKSWLEMRNWAINLFQGEGNLAHRGYRRKAKKDIFAMLFSRILERLPANLRQEIANVPCRGLFTNDVSAYLVSSPKGDVGIIIPWNLYFLVYSGCKHLMAYLDYFVRHTGGQDGKKDRSIEQACDQCLRTVCSIAAQCCDAGPDLIRLPTLLAFDPEYGTLLDRSPSNVTTIVQSALYFILLHEIGHILKDHISSNHYLPVLSEGSKVVLYTTNTLQEHEADSFAITSFLKYGLDIVPGPTHLKLYGPPLVFALYRLREAIFSRWRQFVNKQLDERGVLGAIEPYQDVQGNTVRLWDLGRVNKHLIELPSHSPTPKRLKRIVTETTEYINSNKKADMMVTVTKVVLDTVFNSLVEHLYNEIVVDKVEDKIAKEQATIMVDRILDPSKRTVW